MTDQPIQELRALLFGRGDPELALLLDMVPALPKQLLDLAIEVAIHIEDQPLRDRVWAELASRLVVLGYTLEALEAAREIEENWARAQALERIAPHLPELLLLEALEAAREIGDADNRARALGSLAPHLPEPLREQALREALAAVREIEENWARALALKRIAPHLPELLLPEALEAAWEIEGADNRARALSSLAVHLPEPLREQVVREALAAVREIEDADYRRWELCSLAVHLPEPLREQALREMPAEERELVAVLAALKAAPHSTAMSDEVAGGRVESTRQFLTRVPEDQRTAFLEEVLHALWNRLGKTVQERIVSTGFASESDAAAPLDPAIPLACGQSYYFWLEVGAPVAGSIEETPTPLPVEYLPLEARLKVALFPFEDEIEITPDTDVGELQLLPDGSVQVARQPTQPPATMQDPDLSKRRLFFPVRAPKREGVFHLRCNIYYEQILVQSRVIYAHTMHEPRPVEHALRSVLDYTLTHTLQPEHLTRLAPHRLSLMLNDNGDGTHGFRFFGTQEFKSNASFDGQELEDLIQQSRGVLRLAAWGDERPWQKQAYRYAGPRDLGRLKTDLIHFAIRGYRFYDAIVNRLAGGSAQADMLTELMCEPGLVQIAIKRSARYVLPAAMIYDYGFDTNADFSDYTLCPAFLDALKGETPLEECECFKGSCPSRGGETVICPSGFWGYRHCLGMPFSVANTPDVPPEIVYQQEPEFTVGVSTDPAFKQRPAHERSLQTLCEGLGWNYATTRDETLRLLKETKPHLVYFYCHGGVANNVPYIQVGPPDERGITRDNLRFKKIHWDDTRPLVFINGCHTTALTPEVALEFVSAFVENAAASGVIGTEITVFEPLARAFSEEFLRRFLAGVPIGEAVRGTRLALLKAGNPLGLVYIPFAIASLHLVEWTASS